MTYSTEVLDMQLKSQLKMLIKQKGMTVSSLSKASGVQGQTIHNWLAGSEPRRISDLQKVANTLNVSIDYLVFAKQSDEKHPSIIKEHEDEINAGIFEIVLRRVKKG